MMGFAALYPSYMLPILHAEDIPREAAVSRFWKHSTLYLPVSSVTRLYLCIMYA